MLGERETDVNELHRTIVNMEFELSQLRERLARYKAALEIIAKGVDHPDGCDKAPQFYEAMDWSSGVALEALQTIVSED